jgi:hypothetical protein
VSTAIIAAVVGVLGVGLALSQLFRLKAWLNRPQTDEPAETDQDDSAP